MKIFNRALQRNDSKPSVLGRSNTHSEPQQRVRQAYSCLSCLSVAALNYSFIILTSSLPQIRQINVDAEVQKRERVDIERKVQSQTSNASSFPT